MYRVLLVNDCKLENLIMRDMLVNLGCEVIISNEINAINDVSNLNCNVIIANFIMKEHTGDKILKQVKDKYPGIRCILSSNNDLKSESLKKKNIDAFIHTPVTKKELEKAISGNGNLLSHHKEQVKPLFCTYCGEKSEEDGHKAKFCKYCGEKYDF